MGGLAAGSFMGSGSSPGPPCLAHNSRENSSFAFAFPALEKVGLSYGDHGKCGDGTSRLGLLFDAEPGELRRDGSVWGSLMSHPLNRAEQIRKEASRFSDLAETASSSFLREYYCRLAERYLALEGEWRPSGRQSRSISRRGGFPVNDAEMRQCHDLTGCDLQRRGEAEGAGSQPAIILVCVILATPDHGIKARGEHSPIFWVRSWVDRSSYYSWTMMPRSPTRPRAGSKVWACAPLSLWGPCPRLTFSIATKSTWLLPMSNYRRGNLTALR